MPSKIVSYKLNSDGTIPDFIQDGGYFPSAPTWEDAVLLGVTFADAYVPRGTATYSSKEQVISYLNTYTSGLRDIDPLTREDKGLWSQSDAANFLWSKLNG